MAKRQSKPKVEAEAPEAQATASKAVEAEAPEVQAPAPDAAQEEAPEALASRLSCNLVQVLTGSQDRQETPRPPQDGVSQLTVNGKVLGSV